MWICRNRPFRHRGSHHRRGSDQLFRLGLGAIGSCEDELRADTFGLEFGTVVGFSPFGVRRRRSSCELAPPLWPLLVPERGAGRCARERGAAWCVWFGRR